MGGQRLTRNLLNRSLEAGTASIHYRSHPKVATHVLLPNWCVNAQKGFSLCEIDVVPSEVSVQRLTNMRTVFPPAAYFKSYCVMVFKMRSHSGCGGVTVGVTYACD